MPRRRSRGRPAPGAASRPAHACNPRPRPGLENVPNQVHDSNQPVAPYDRVPTHCYHLSGDDEIHSIGALKDFQIRSHLSRKNLKDFQIGSIGSRREKQFRNVFSRRATDAIRNKTFDMEERKLFISSGCNHLWQEKLYGITRVAVYGVDSVCVATREEDLLQLEKDCYPRSDVPFTLPGSTPRNALIAEVLDLAYSPGESRKKNAKRSQKPFGVVSVTTGTNEQASSDKFDEPKAIEFLREEMKSTSTFTYFKTVKTAICALEHLCHKKFKPDEIRVLIWKSAWKSNYYSKVYTLQELKIRDERSIKDILDLINKRHIAGSG